MFDLIREFKLVQNHSTGVYFADFLFIRDVLFFVFLRSIRDGGCRSGRTAAFGSAGKGCQSNKSPIQPFWPRLNPLEVSRDHVTLAVHILDIKLAHPRSNAFSLLCIQFPFDAPSCAMASPPPPPSSWEQPITGQNGCSRCSSCCSCIFFHLLLALLFFFVFSSCCIEPPLDGDFRWLSGAEPSFLAWPSAS